jgi:hypothetical protein
LAISGELHDVTVLIIIGERMILVTPGREFDLGIVRPDERVVRELIGNEVVAVRVVKAIELRRDEVAPKGKIVSSRHSLDDDAGDPDHR